MPYTISWYVEKRVILVRYTGVVTVDELVQLSEDLTPHIDVAIPLVHVISLQGDAERFPASLNEVKKQLTKKPDERLGWVINVMPNQVIRFMGSVIMQMMRQRTRQFATLEEALDFLQESDPSLPDLRQKPPISCEFRSVTTPRRPQDWDLKR